MNNYIGLNIKYLCDKNFLSQIDFGNIIDAKQSTVATYVSGRSNPSIETIQKICKHFEITIDDFINLDLSSSGKEYKASKATAIAAKPAAAYQDNNIIFALKETIEAQKETIQAQKSQIETLRSQLGHAS